MIDDVVVVDASLALKWVLSEDDSDKARKLLQEWIKADVEIIAPALFAYEITSIIYRQVVTKKLSYDDASKSLAELFSMGVFLEFSHYEEISIQSMQFAHRFNLPAAYDAQYLSLAFHEDCLYWTTDTKLWNAVQGNLHWVRLLKDYSLP